MNTWGECAKLSRDSKPNPGSKQGTWSCEAVKLGLPRGQPNLRGCQAAENVTHLLSLYEYEWANWAYTFIRISNCTLCIRCAPDPQQTTAVLVNSYVYVYKMIA